MLYVVGLSLKGLLKELASRGMDLPDRRSEPSRSGRGLLLDYTSKPTPRVQAVLMYLRALRRFVDSREASMQLWFVDAGTFVVLVTVCVFEERALNVEGYLRRIVARGGRSRKCRGMSFGDHVLTFSCVGFE